MQAAQTQVVENGGISITRRRERANSRESTYSGSLSGSWHRKLVFGIPIIASLSEKDCEPLPPAIDACLTFIEEKALDTNYLFLLRDNPDKLRKAVEEGAEVDFGKYSPHTISNLVLYYLETIPTPLITPEVYKVLMTCDPGMIWRIAIIVEKLPSEHYNLLKRLCAILKNVADNSHQNDVSIQDLANTIEPIITRTPSGTEASELLALVNKSKEMTKSLILNCAEIFSYSTTVPNFGNGEDIQLRIEDVYCAHYTGSEQNENNNTSAGEKNNNSNNSNNNMNGNNNNSSSNNASNSNNGVNGNSNNSNSGVKYFNGVMWITNYQLMWKSIDAGEGRIYHVRIPHRSVNSLECVRPQGKIKSGSNLNLGSNFTKSARTGIHVKCHTFRFESFLFSNKKSCKQVFELLSQFCFDNARELFAFENTETFESTGGWKAYKRKEEFARLGFTSCWRISTANKIYDLCDVYPKRIIIPASIADITLFNCSRSRDHSRIPIAVWRHPSNYAVLLRSSPTTLSETTNRGDEDTAGVQLIEAVLANVKRERMGSPQLSAMPCSIEVADLSGGAPATAVYYKCIQSIWFADLPTYQCLLWNFQALQVHVMHSAYVHDQWEKQITQSRYLSHVKSVLSAGRKLAQMLHSGTCVISQSTVKDGFDLMECAVVSLSLLLLDPYYRTLAGFIVLIEKEWNQFAYPFHPTKLTDPNKYFRKADVAPVFVLFLDCVWQIYKEMPAAFEFNERFLVFLADQSIFARFGTFLCGVDRSSLLTSTDTMHRERLDYEVLVKTGSSSAWDYVTFHKEKFVNCLFSPYCTLLSGTHLIRVQLWQTYFLRFTTCPNRGDFWRQVNHLRATNGENLYLQALKLPYMMDLEKNTLKLFHSIKTVDLSSNYFNCYPVELLLSTRLSKLNMQKNRLKTFPPSAFIAQMSNLLELILATNQIDALPTLPQVSMFSSLTVLKLGGNKIENVESLGVLTSLIHLDLSENCISLLPNNLSNLQSLQELLLFSNCLSTFPENLSGMTALRKLSLSDNKFSTMPAGIYQLTNLQVLELDENAIMVINDEMVNLQNLQIFNFSNNKISHFPHALCALESLVYLNLSRNELNYVPPKISRMTNLVQLILESNSISDIPLEIGNLLSLTELNLQNNVLTEIPPSIGQLLSLKHLELRSNPLSYLPHTIGLLSSTIRYFAVDACSCALVPQLQAVVSRGADEVLKYLHEDMNSEKINFNTKVLVVGNEGSGKTSFVNNLLKKHKKNSDNCHNSPTNGISVENWQFNTSKDSTGTTNTVNVNIWDLAGHERYRPAQQLILPQACVSIVVWNILHGESEIEYWIRFLTARMVEAKPIIFVVATHVDHQNAPKLKKNALIEMQNKYKEIFPLLEIYYAAVGNMAGSGISDLRKDMQSVIYQKLMTQKPIPTSWQLLEKCISKERLKRNNIPIMNGIELGRLCQACGIDTARGIRRAMAWLHNNSNLCFLEPIDGPSLDNIPVAMNLHGIALLSPTWLCTSFSSIFSQRLHWAKGAGYDELGQIWKYPEIDTHIPQLLALAESFFLEFQMMSIDSSL